MRRTNKKGFTIVELVIVIAVIAILAAVLIPTFSSLVNKANQSADIQAVRQMNTILATYTDGSIKTVADAVKVLDQDSIDLDNYKPLAKDHYFYFYIENGTPKVVYMDKADNAVYPEDAKTEGVQLMSLSGDVPEDGSYTVAADGKVSISSGSQLAHLMNNIDDVYAKNPDSIEVTLTGDIDLKGSSASFGLIKKNITINGNGKKIAGVRADSNTSVGSWQGAAKTYGYALFNEVDSGVTVTVKDINISGVVVSDTSDSTTAFGHSGVLFGRVNGTVNVSNVTIDNCTVYGGDKVGALIGYLNGTANLSNITVTNTSLYGVGWIAKAIGYATQTSTMDIENVNCDGVTMGINERDWSKVWKGDDTNWKTGELVKQSDAKIYSETGNNSNTYLPYIQNKDQVGKEENHWEGMITNDLYWKAIWTEKEGGMLPTSGN